MGNCNSNMVLKPLFLQEVGQNMIRDLSLCSCLCVMCRNNMRNM
jgi:hypothetical protein